MKLGSFDWNLPFERVIEELARRNVELPDAYYGALDGLHRQLSFSIAGVSSLDQLQLVLNSLTESVADGSTFAEWQKNVDVKALGLPKHRLDNIYRTNFQGSYNRGRWEQFQENKDDMPFLLYDAINDSRTRPSHSAMDGIIRKIDDPFWNVWYPSNGFRCVLPWTKITGDFEIGLKSFYSGEAIEIITKSGKRLSVTANHPILSNDGWVCANSLKKGSSLIRHINIGNIELSGIVDNKNPPARADDIFNSLASEAMGIADISAFKFHDDTHLRKSKIYVAGVDSKLLNWVKPTSIESIKQWNFKWTHNFSCTSKTSPSSSSLWCGIVKKFIFSHNPFDVGRRAVIFTRNLDNAFTSPIRRYYSFFKFIINSARSKPSRATLPINQLRTLFNFFPFQNLSVTLASSDNTSITKPFFNGITTNLKSFCDKIFAFTRNISVAYLSIINNGYIWFWSSVSNFIRFSPSPSFNPVIPKDSIKETFTDSIVFKDFSDRFSSQVSIDEVVSVRNFFFSGHVYDFQCKNSVIVADGIITHNCRCRAIPLTESQANRRSKDGTGLNQKIDESVKVDKGWDYNVGQDFTRGIEQAIQERRDNPNIEPKLLNTLELILKLFEQNND